MKRIVLAVLLLLAASPVLMAQGNEIYVKNLTEFILALKSNRVIVLDQDIDFADQLTKISENNSKLLPLLNTWDNEAQIKARTNGCYISDNTDGRELWIKGMENITIKGREDVLMMLRIEPRYAYVLNFLECKNIKLVNLCMGHTDAGYCDGGVVNFQDCSNITITNCDMYGCGTEGIRMSNSSNLKMTNSFIRNCSYNIMTLSLSSDVVFDRCFFFDNREYDMLEIHSTRNVLFDNCVFSNNQGHMFNVTDSQVIMRRTFINHNEEESRISDNNLDNVEFENCIFNNCPGFIKKE